MAAENGLHYMPPALKDLPFETLIKMSSVWGRLAEPEEIAAAVAFLVSPDASYITGSTLFAEAGR
jgi:3-oxoacyl-[acyl-carrier protein] reductase/tetrahydroxynaphthalene reductase